MPLSRIAAGMHIGISSPWDSSTSLSRRKKPLAPWGKRMKSHGSQAWDAELDGRVSSGTSAECHSLCVGEDFYRVPLIST